MAPWMVSILLLVPLLTAALIVPIQFHWDLGRMAKLMTFEMWALGVGGVFAFAFGSYLTAHTRPMGSGPDIADLAASPAIRRLLVGATWGLLGVTVAAYFIWFMPVFRNPAILVAILTGRAGDLQLRETIGTIPGVTTLVQAQIPYVALLLIRWIYIPGAQPSRLEKAALGGVFLLALMRNFVWSERIAVIEFLVPFAILFLRKPRWPRVTAIAPFFAVAGLVAFFSIFEYFRSWLAYYQFRYDSFAIFIMARLSGYYVTALDNGAGLVRDWAPVGGPLSTADWLWRFPLEIGQTWLADAIGLARFDHASWLYWNASPEFNNSSGIFMPFVDYGAAGGLVFWLLFGMLTGLIYRGFVRGGFAGLLIYPSWFVGMLEMPRILYLCEARYFPVVIICLLLIFLVSTVSAQEAKACATRPVI